MASTKIAAFERQLHLASVGRLTGREHQQAFIAVAREGRDEVVAEQTERASGVALSVETQVDGSSESGYAQGIEACQYEGASLRCC